MEKGGLLCPVIGEATVHCTHSVTLYNHQPDHTSGKSCDERHLAQNSGRVRNVLFQEHGHDIRQEATKGGWHRLVRNSRYSNIYTGSHSDRPSSIVTEQTGTWRGNKSRMSLNLDFLCPRHKACSGERVFSPYQPRMTPKPFFFTFLKHLFSEIVWLHDHSADERL